MPSFEVAVSWMVLCPIAFFFCLLGVLFILHYNPLFHSVDVALISLLVTMACNVWLLLPIQAVMELADYHWSEELCTFYAWLATTLRSSHLLVIVVFNVYWMASLRVSDNGRLFTSSKSIKICVSICWFISVIIGLVPVAGGNDIFDFFDPGYCKFLPSNIDVGLGILFITISLFSVVVGLISTSDTLVLFHHMRQVALNKYNAGRFHPPSQTGVADHSASSNIHARYNELNVARELCIVVLCWTIVSSLINILPFMATQFIELVQANHDPSTIESTLLWLLLAEALTLPHLPWILSKRYRHAVTYSWKVYILKDENAKEEDVAACTLQSFKLSAKDHSHRPSRNGVGASPKVNIPPMTLTPPHQFELTLYEIEASNGVIELHCPVSTSQTEL